MFFNDNLSKFKHIFIGYDTGQMKDMKTIKEKLKSLRFIIANTFTWTWANLIHAVSVMSHENSITFLCIVCELAGNKNTYRKIKMYFGTELPPTSSFSFISLSHISSSGILIFTHFSETRREYEKLNLKVKKKWIFTEVITRKMLIWK